MKIFDMVFAKLTATQDRMIYKEHVKITVLKTAKVKVQRVYDTNRKVKRQARHLLSMLSPLLSNLSSMS